MLGCSRTSLVVCVTAGLFIGAAQARCPQGDLNGDCQVDLLDVQILAAQWLVDTQSPADLTGDDRVNIRDFATLAAYWHKASVPLAISQMSSKVNQRLRNCSGRFVDGGDIGAQVYSVAC